MPRKEAIGCIPKGLVFTLGTIDPGPSSCTFIFVLLTYFWNVQGCVTSVGAIDCKLLLSFTIFRVHQLYTLPQGRTSAAMYNSPAELPSPVTIHS